jgi:hypothetical protein
MGQFLYDIFQSLTSTAAPRSYLHTTIFVIPWATASSVSEPTKGNARESNIVRDSITGLVDPFERTWLSAADYSVTA